MVSASKEVYHKLIVPVVGWPVVPVVVVDFVDGSQKIIQDTAVIIDFFENLVGDTCGGNRIHPDRSKQRIVSEIIGILSDQYLAQFPAMHYRWNFPEINEDFLIHEWDRVITPGKHVFGTIQEKNASLNAAKQKANSFGSTLPVLGVNGLTISEVVKEYEMILQHLNTHLQQHQYLLGDKPCLGDFALMGPLYAHLFRDPAPGRMLKSQAPYVAEYVERLSLDVFPVEEVHLTKLANGKFKFEEEFNTSRTFVPNDSIPETLLPIIDVFFRHHFPILESTVDRLREYILINGSSGELPRILGQHTFRLGNKQSTRAAFTFDVWKLQNVLDIWRLVSKKEGVRDFICTFGENGIKFADMNINDIRVYKNVASPNKQSTIFMASNSKL